MNTMKVSSNSNQAKQSSSQNDTTTSVIHIKQVPSKKLPIPPTQLSETNNEITEKSIEKKVLSKDFLTFVGYSVRTTGYAGIRLTYKIDMEMLAEIEYECDVRIITYVTDKNGVTKTVEPYGKYSYDRYSDDGEFSVVIKPSNYYDEYEVKTVVRLMNFRGVEYVDFDLGALATDTNGKISLCEVAENVLATSTNLGTKEKAFYESIVAGK